MDTRLRSITIVALFALRASCVAADPADRQIAEKLVSKDSHGDTVIAEVILLTSEAPDLREWARDAGRQCLEWLPRIAALLPSPGFIPPKSVTLRFDGSMKGVAHTNGAVITISAGYVRAHKDDLGMVIHELTHVVQDYQGKGEGWLTEGIADYIRHQHYQKDADTLAKRIKPDSASYRQAYTTAAAFLVWLEMKKDHDIVRKLNAASRDGSYRHELFKEFCGAELDVLWKEFMDSLPASRAAAKNP